MHWFLRGLLNEWGLELQHLNPTRVLHVAGFITVCEAFLRMLHRTSLVGGEAAEERASGEFCPVEEVEAIGLLPRIYPLRLQSGVVWGVVLH